MAGETGRRWRPGPLLLALAAVVAIGGLAWAEVRTSWLQAHVLAGWAAEIDYGLDDGPASATPVPPAGPFDRRRGYTRIAELRTRLEERGFRTVAQARISHRFRRSLDLGFFPIYREKTRAGLEVVDATGRPIHVAAYPARTYPAFDSVPDVVVRTLLHIENRELLAERAPHRNPAVEWDRLARAVVSLGLSRLSEDGSTYGGSTLATQMEKFRHSPGGVTGSPAEKFRQMGSATLRAYRAGAETLETRRRIVLDYLNAVPLAAVPGYGEVIGLGDGLPLWTGIEFEAANEVLRALPAAGSGTAVGEPAARTYRAVLALLVAHRRPSYYLANPDGRERLRDLVDRHLDILARDSVISGKLATAARDVEVEVYARAPRPTRSSFVTRKAANAIRAHLLGLLGVSSLYELDRYDLSVGTTLDRAAHDGVTDRLLRLADPADIRAAGLEGARLLGAGDPAKVVYSVLVYERTPIGHAVRVQTDNFDAPFDLNQSGRLELGSTAKFRTLVTYLDVIEELYLELAGLSAEDLAGARARAVPDPLTRWALDLFARRPETTLREALEAAMDRRYSANPSERFFTGGGSHVFQNFDRTFDGAVVSVREGFRHSINLVFVRLMRDIVRYHTYRIPGSSARLLEDPADPRRQDYLRRFADREGRQFVERFHRKHAGKPPAEILTGLVSGRRLSPERLAWAFRSVAPEAGMEEFASFLRSQSPDAALPTGALENLYERTEVGRFGLADRGYLARIHPLELWVVGYLLQEPEASLEEAVEESAGARQEVYRWLFESRRRAAQDQRIRILLEVEAFMEIQREWQRLGYPFENLVPSFGTAIGSSGDRPGALAELVGILLSDGIRHPVVRVDSLRFASGTPYETVLRRQAQRGRRVLSREVAAVARAALRDVVANGTARAANRLFEGADGVDLAIGGKTGTGNNQYRVFGPGGRLVESRTVNRTATFVFYIGDRLFGVITAHVPGPDAEAFRFTSALPVRLLAVLREEVGSLSAPRAEPASPY